MVTAKQVVGARLLMAGGYSMKDAARLLDVTPSSELDRALWSNIATTDDELAPATRRPEPMF